MTILGRWQTIFMIDPEPGPAGEPVPVAAWGTEEGARDAIIAKQIEEGAIPKKASDDPAGDWV